MMATLETYQTPKFITFPSVTYDPKFGEVDTQVVDEDPYWIEAAASVVFDPKNTRSTRLQELRSELSCRNITIKPGDENQLIGFLRAGQGNVTRALKVVDVFLQYQQYNKNALPRDVEPMLSDTLSDLAVLPHRDKYGRRIIVYKMWDAEKWPYKKGMEAFYAINLLLSREAKTQVAGITMIGDFSGMSRKHMSTNMEDIRAWSNLISGGVPVWFHRSHICNAPWLFEILFAVIKPFLSESARNGVILHKKSAGWTDLHKEIGSADILPKEFGGNAGSLDNSQYLKALLDASDYFETLRECKQDI